MFNLVSEFKVKDGDKSSLKALSIRFQQLFLEKELLREKREKLLEELSICSIEMHGIKEEMIRIDGQRVEIFNEYKV